VLDIDPKRRPYRTRDGRFYIRIGAEKREISRGELSVWLDEIRPLAYENVPLAEVVETDFDDALLWSFADAFDSEPDVDRAGKVDRPRIAATGLDHEADGSAALKIEQARADQPLVHRDVEPLVVDRVVNVAVAIGIRPTQRNARPRPVRGAFQKGRSRQNAAS
jgi:hypothetical protein